MSDETTTALATRGTAALVPAYLRDDEETLRATSIDFSGDDFALPRLAICQDLTPYRKRTIMGQQNERFIAGLEPGDIFVGLTKTNYGAGPVEFVVLDYFRSNRYFVGGKIACRADNGAGCSYSNGGACAKNKWDNTKSGKEAKPPCTEIFNYVVRVLESGEYAVLSFKSTGIKIAKEFVNGQLKDSVQPGVAIYRKVFALGVTPDKNPEGEWFLPSVRRPAIKVPDDDGRDVEMGKIVTDKGLCDELKRHRIALRKRSAPVIVVEEDGPSGEDGAAAEELDDDIPF